MPPMQLTIQPQPADFVAPETLKLANGLAPQLTQEADSPYDFVPDNPNSPRIVFFSSISENTWRFAVKLGFPAVRIPVYERRDPQPLVNEPYVILVPTYGGGNMHGAVPKQAIHFLNIKANRDLCVGVMSNGQKNFGKYYCIAADIIAHKCGVRPLYRFELMGTPEDVRRAREGMEELWQSQILRHHSPEPKA